MAREWRGVSSQYRFRCEIGHVSSQSGESLGRFILGGRGPLQCHQCWVEQTMTRIHKSAGSAGGQCLSKRYRGKGAHYRFVCAAGHKFEATAASVLGGHWCAKCWTERRSERRKYQGGLKPIQDRARERGGECLLTVYDGRMAKYRFRCGAGHEWEAAGYDALRKAWCQECSSDRKRMPDGLAKLQAKAVEHGGKCLASRYQRIQARYRALDFHVASRGRASTKNGSEHGRNEPPESWRSTPPQLHYFPAERCQAAAGAAALTSSMSPGRRATSHSRSSAT